MLEYLAKDRRRLRHGTRAFTREIDDGMARIFVDHGFQWDGSNNVWLTRARASFVMGAGPEFDIRPRTVLSRVLGFQAGVPSGDFCFDNFFVVRTSATETWDALTTRVRSLLASEFEDARLVSNGRMVSLWREGDFGREADAEAAAELVAELVHYGSEVLDELRRLPSSTFRPPNGPWDDRTAPAVTVHTPVAVDIGPIEENGATTMVARARCGRSMRPFWLEIDGDGGVRGNCERFPVSVAGAVAQVGNATIRCNGNQVSLRWPTLETRRERLTAGAHLIGAFSASQSTGLYR